MVGQVNSAICACGSACRASLHLFMGVCQLAMIHHSAGFLRSGFFSLSLSFFLISPCVLVWSMFDFTDESPAKKSPQMIKGSGREIIACEGQNSVIMPPRTTTSSLWRVNSHIKLPKECNMCLFFLIPCLSQPRCFCLAVASGGQIITSRLRWHYYSWWGCFCSGEMCSLEVQRLNCSLRMWENKLSRLNIQGDAILSYRSQTWMEIYFFLSFGRFNLPSPHLLRNCRAEIYWLSLYE